MSGQWLLVEDSRQAAEAVDMAARGSGVRYLTTSPAAYDTLQRGGLEPVCLFSFLPFADLNRAAADNDVVARRLCGSLDRLLGQSRSGLPAGFQPFDALLLQIKCALDGLMFRQLELERFLESEEPDPLCYWPPPPSRRFTRLQDQMAIHSQPFLWAAAESPAASLLEAWGDAPTRRLHRRESTHREPLPDIAVPGFGRFETAVRARVNVNRLSGLLHLRGRALGRESSVRLRLGVLGSDDEILSFLRHATGVVATGIDWWKELSRPPVSLRTCLAVKPTPRSTRHALAPWSLDEVRSMFEPAFLESELSEPARSVVAERLARFAYRRIPLLLELSDNVQQYLEKRRPAAMITGTTVGDSLQVVAQQCRMAAVKLVSFQHGGNFGYVRMPQLAHGDLRVPDIFCVFGEGARRGLERQRAAAQNRPRILPLGWARQGRAYLSPLKRTPRGRTSQRPRVRSRPRPALMYVATNLVGDGRFGPRYWYDDTAYYLHQVELIRALLGFRRFSLTVKLHFKDRTDNPIGGYVEREHPDDVRLEKATPLPQLLDEHAVIVIDWPATAMLEAMARAKATVYVDLGWLAWEEDARGLLEREARWISKHDRSWRLELGRALDELAAGTQVRAGTGFLDDYASDDYRPELLLRELRLAAGRGA